MKDPTRWPDPLLMGPVTPVVGQQWCHCPRHCRSMGCLWWTWTTPVWEGQILALCHWWTVSDSSNWRPIQAWTLCRQFLSLSICHVQRRYGNVGQSSKDLWPGWKWTRCRDQLSGALRAPQWYIIAGGTKGLLDHFFHAHFFSLLMVQFWNLYYENCHF